MVMVAEFRVNQPMAGSPTKKQTQRYITHRDTHIDVLVQNFKYMYMYPIIKTKAK